MAQITIKKTWKITCKKHANKMNIKHPQAVPKIPDRKKQQAQK